MAVDVTLIGGPDDGETVPSGSHCPCCDQATACIVSPAGEFYAVIPEPDGRLVALHVPGMSEGDDRAAA